MEPIGLCSDLPIMADFGNAVVSQQGRSVFDEDCESVIDITLTEQVVISALVPLSEEQAQEGTYSHRPRGPLHVCTCILIDH